MSKLNLLKKIAFLGLITVSAPYFNYTNAAVIPCCSNCDFILDNCERNGWKPAGLCNYCATGNCSPNCPNIAAK